jgi:hypothetical protein
MSNQERVIPPVDLFIVIDSSPSIKDEVQALSNATASAISSLID